MPHTFHECRELLCGERWKTRWQRIRIPLWVQWLPLWDCEAQDGFTEKSPYLIWPTRLPRKTQDSGNEPIPSGMSAHGCRELLFSESSKPRLQRIRISV